MIPEPIGKWCNIQKDGDDVYQVNIYNTVVDCGAALLRVDGPFLCLMELHVYVLNLCRS